MEGSSITEHYTPAVPAPLKTQIGLQYLCSRAHCPDLYRRRLPGNTPPGHRRTHTRRHARRKHCANLQNFYGAASERGLHIQRPPYISTKHTHSQQFLPPRHHDHKCHIIVMYSHRLKVSAMASRPRSHRP